MSKKYWFGIVILAVAGFSFSLSRNLMLNRIKSPDREIVTVDTDCVDYARSYADVYANEKNLPLDHPDVYAVGRSAYDRCVNGMIVPQKRILMDLCEMVSRN